MRCTLCLPGPLEFLADEGISICTPLRLHNVPADGDCFYTAATLVSTALMHVRVGPPSVARLRSDQATDPSAPRVHESWSPATVRLFRELVASHLDAATLEHWQAAAAAGCRDYLCAWFVPNAVMSVVHLIIYKSKVSCPCSRIARW
jgi:hypothetical protein